MIKNVTIITNYNLYESKRYFAEKLAEAMQRYGLLVKLVDMSNMTSKKGLFDFVTSTMTDLTCTFHYVMPTQGKYFWELTKVPHWAILVDAAYYSRNLLTLSNVMISCVDRDDLEYARSHSFENMFFWPHAVEKELSYEKNEQRPYDVVLIGSCYDHEYLKECWRKSNSPIVCKVIEEAIEMILADNCSSLIPSIHLALKNNGLKLEEVDFDAIVLYVDNYMRGKDRFELIKGIKNTSVHVFGGTCWRKEQPVHSWSYNLRSLSNVIVHPPLSFKESLEVLKKSKICLNSVPSFKNGTHERIFTGLACGALPITTDTLWVRENFVDKEELFLYRANQYEEVNEMLLKVLDNENLRNEMVIQGREKVMREHTWDVRVGQFLEKLPAVKFYTPN